MRIEVAPSDGIDKYEYEMKIIYDALQEVMHEDFSGAMITDESYITDFLTFGNREQRNNERAQLEEVLGISLNNPSLISICRMLHIKASA